jgi:uncharacterized protein with ParB-like and HNH nuclease domain
VYAPLKTDGVIQKYVIIDGQQRLTTVYILIKALVDMADDEKQKEYVESDLINTDKFDELKIDVASKLKLKPVKSDNEQLLFLMDNKYEKMDKTCSIWRNYEHFCDLIGEQKNLGLTVKDIYAGIEKLRVARIELDKGDDAQETFERINSTGVRLTVADLIRNYVLMTDSNQEKLYEEYWLPAEQALHTENLNAFFIDYLNFKIEGFAKEDEAYSAFKELFKKGKYTNESMLKEIHHYAMFYKAFLYGDNEYSVEINDVLKEFQKLKQTTVFLFLFHIFDDYKNNIINETELVNVLKFVRNYSIRRLVCEVGSNSLRGFYKTLYARAFANSENKKHYYDAIVSFVKQLTSKDRLITDQEFIQALEQNNLYRKNALCKYLLASIENQGKEKVLTENLSIEHIMPQNKNLSNAWQKMLGNNWNEVRDKYLHTLGNLTLTGYNSELGDKPFDEKKRLIEDVDSKVVTLYEDVKDKKSWNEDAIVERAKHLSEIILNIFEIKEPSEIVSFKAQGYQEYGCDEPSEATNKVPNYYIFQGEQIECRNFADMLKKFVRQLYSLDSSIIEAMARKDEILSSYGTYAMFSYDETRVKNNYKIKGTDIYQNTGFSAYDIVWIIKALLDKYDIEHTEFVYSARQND